MLSKSPRNKYGSKTKTTVLKKNNELTKTSKTKDLHELNTNRSKSSSSACLRSRSNVREKRDISRLPNDISKLNVSRNLSNSQLQRNLRHFRSQDRRNINLNDTKKNTSKNTDVKHTRQTSATNNNGRQNRYNSLNRNISSSKHRRNFSTENLTRVNKSNISHNSKEMRSQQRIGNLPRPNKKNKRPTISHLYFAKPIKFTTPEEDTIDSLEKSLSSLSESVSHISSSYIMLDVKIKAKTELNPYRMSLGSADIKAIGEPYVPRFIAQYGSG